MTYLLLSNSEDSIRKEILVILQREIETLQTVKIKKIEDITHPDVHLINGFETGTIGIADIRAFTRILHKKPFKAKVHIGIILGFETATVEAQNALLKEFEDHPKTVIYVLGAVDESPILATIRSRASIQYIGAQVPQKEHKELVKFVSLYTDKSEDVLSAFATVQKKEWTRQSAETFLSELYNHITKNKESKRRLLALQKSGEYLRNNVSPKQVLTYLLLLFRQEV